MQLISDVEDWKNVSSMVTLNNSSDAVCRTVDHTRYISAIILSKPPTSYWGRRL